MRPGAVVVSLQLALSVLAALFSIRLPPASAQLILTVNSTADAPDANPGDGICETGAGNGICTLRAAVMEANDLDGTDTIELPPGTFTLTVAGSGDASVGDLNITESLALVGAGAGSTIVDGGQIDRVFDVRTVPGHTVALSGMTVRNGELGGGGAGICNCTPGATVTLSQMTITANNAFGVGGGGLLNYGFMTVISSTVSHNVGHSFGGGIQNNGVMSVVATTIAGNLASGDALGGGIGNSGVMTVTASTISGNEARMLDFGSNGGGLANTAGTLTLINSTLTGNWALSGGGVYNAGGATLTVTHGTIANNVATGSSVVPRGDNFYVQGSITLINSIVAGGEDENCNAPLTSGGHNLDSDDTCGLDAPGDRVNTDPQLSPLSYHGGPTATHAPSRQSPALDAGDDSVCPLDDQRGAARPVDGDGDGVAHCDIGALERGWPGLWLDKRGPAMALAGEFITYTLVITNPMPISVTNVILTDTVPFGASHVSGGTVANGIASWVVGAMNPGAVITRLLVVTATASITNDDYRVSAGEGYSTTGATAVTTLVVTPIAGLQANNDGPTVLGQPTTLTATITAGSDVIYTWAFGDGATGFGAMATYTYSTPGEYTAVVTATNPAGTAIAGTVVSIARVDFRLFIPVLTRTAPAPTHPVRPLTVRGGR